MSIILSFSLSAVCPQFFFNRKTYVFIKSFRLEAWRLKIIYVVVLLSVFVFTCSSFIAMKVVYPKNIKRGLLAGMTFSIWPLTISIVQMFIIAVWVSLALAAFNAFWKSWSKAIGLFVAIIIIIITLIITFFKVSELSLLPYISKLIRNNFFDAKKKFQVNYEKKNPIDIMIQEAKSKEEKQIIEQKESTFDQQSIADIEKKGLI